MKIVVLDKPRENPGEIDWSEVSRLGDARIYDDTPQDKIAETIGDAEIVFVNKGKITKEILDACPNVKFISVVATGFNKIDLESAKENGILVQAWSPLGTGRMLTNETLIEIAKKYNKSVAQLCIRWCLQHDVLPLPKSVTQSRIVENTDVFDFVIGQDDMNKIDALPNFGGSGLHPDRVDF